VTTRTQATAECFEPARRIVRALGVGASDDCAIDGLAQAVVLARQARGAAGDADREHGEVPPRREVARNDHEPRQRAASVANGSLAATPATNFV
jgi:hypothetical protein